MRRTSVALLLALLYPLDVDGEDAEPSVLATTHADLRNLTVGGSLPAPPVIAIGRATLRPAPGARALVLTAGGRACGVVIDGAVDFEYVVEDQFSEPVAWRTLVRTKLRPRQADGNIVVSERLQGAAFWGWDIPGVRAEGPGAPVPEWLQDVWQRKLDVEPERELLLAAWNQERGYRWAILHGGDDYVLQVDPRSSARLEKLGRLRKLQFAPRHMIGKLVTETLAAQPIGRDWWGPTDIAFASLDTSIELRNDHGAHAVISTTTRLRALRHGLRLLSLLLLEEDIDYRGGRHPLELAKLTVDGQPANYLRLRDALLVELSKPLSQGAEVVIDTLAQGDVLSRPAGDNYWWLGIGPWYTQPGSGGQEWATLNLSVEARAPFVPFAGGEIAKREATATGNRLTSRLAGPMQAASALAGKYATYSEESSGQRVHVSTYAGGNENEARTIGRIVLGVSSCLGSWLGTPYPFQDLQVVEVHDWGFGQAPPGLIFITREAFLTPASSRTDGETIFMSRMTSRGVNMRIAHEVAHGWFPHVMKVVTPEEAWLSESFADYASAVCLRRSLVDTKLGDRLWDTQVKEWRNAADEVRGTSIYLVNWLSDHQDDQRAGWRVLYGKGPFVLHALRGELAKSAGSQEAGDALFFNWFRAVVQSHVYKTGHTRDLVAELDRLTGKAWQPWFERYVYGTETPELD